MNTILNIGLGPSKARPEGTTLAEALDKVLRTFRTAYIEFVTVTNSEPTLVVVLPPMAGASVSGVYRLSESLGQDCIAMISPAFQYGTLVGPEAQTWADGTFDPAHFVGPRWAVHF